MGSFEADRILATRATPLDPGLGQEVMDRGGVFAEGTVQDDGLEEVVKQDREEQRAQASQKGARVAGRFKAETRHRITTTGVVLGLRSTCGKREISTIGAELVKLRHG